MKEDKFQVLYALGFAWQLGFLVIFNIGIFALLGYFLDKLFHTRSLFLILGFAIGPIAAGYQIYAGLIPLFKKGVNDKK